MNLKKLLAYGLYDAGNSNYVSLVPSIAFPILLKHIIDQKHIAVDFLWGALILLSSLLVIFLSPILGELADRKGIKLLLLRFTTYLSIAGTATMFFLEINQVLLTIIVFIITNTSFLLAVVFYDASLSNVSSKEDAGMISSIAWGIGYAGGLVGLVLSLAVLGGVEFNLRYVFVICAILFFVFTLPLLWSSQIRNEPIVDENRKRKTLCQIIRAFTDSRTRTQFLVAYFLYSNAISTVIYFTSIFATTTLGYSLKQLIWLFIAMSIVGAPTVIIFGKFVRKIGHTRLLKVILLLWLGVVFVVSMAGPKSFAIIACCAAALLGPIQALSRSLFRIIFPEEYMTSYFGVQAIASRSSALFGPLLFGTVSYLTSSQRIAVMITAILLFCALIVLSKVETINA